MKPERWQQIDQILDGALQKEGSQRKAYLDEACSGDASLRHEVESLLEASERAESFIEAPALEETAQAMAENQVQSIVGREIGSYKVLSLLGTGGMGEVYLAEDRRLDRKVALKFLPEEMQRDETARKRFLREAKSLAALDHAYICHIHEVAEAEGKSFISMEYVQGKTLKDQLEKGPLSLQDALAKATEIAEALEAAHRQKIIHRDLKPSNIMITSDGHVKVLDFGLAKRLTPPEGPDSQGNTLSSSLTATGATLGTLAYMSPEQLREEEVDTRSDAFSFGVVLYQMLTGVHPFLRDTAMDTCGAILNDVPAPLLEHTENVPSLLEHTVRKMLAKDPRRRYQLIQEVRNDLLYLSNDVLLEVIEQPAEPQRAVLTPSSVSRMNRVAFPVLIAALIILGWISWQSPPKPLTRHLDLSLPAPYAPWEQGYRMAVSGDGKHFVYLGRRDDLVEIYHRVLDQAEWTRLSGTEGASRLFLSPDGQWVGFYADGKLKKAPLAGGPPVTIGDIDPYFGAAWEPGGSIILGSLQSGLSRISAAGGTLQSITTLDAEQGHTAHALPTITTGGRALLFDIRLPGPGTSASTGESPIGILSLDTGRWKTLHSGTYPRYAASGHLLYMRSPSRMTAAIPLDLDQNEVTGDPVNLDFLRESDFTLSEDGLLVYCRRPQPSEWSLVLVGRDGVGRPLMESKEAMLFPRFSPNGKLVALNVGGTEADPRIRIYDVTRDVLASLAPSRFGAVPIWADDGRRVVFTSKIGGTLNLFWCAADGSGEIDPFLESEHVQIGGSWGGKSLLAYTETKGHYFGSGDIYVGTAQGDVEPFSATEFDERQPAFSPDGQWIAFTSNRSGQHEVYLKRFRGNGGPLQLSRNGGTEPAWAPSGRELFYVNGASMMVVPFRTQPTLEPEEPQKLFEGVSVPGVEGVGRNYDVGPDGQSFVMIQNSQEHLSTTSFKVVLNWFEEIRRLVPTDH